MFEKKLLEILGFSPKENATGVFYKKFHNYNNYIIEIDFEKKSINYGNLIQAQSKTTQNFSQPENFVVLECVNRLLDKGYQPQNIVLEKTWATGHGTSGRLDILVTRNDGSAYLMIECKTWGNEFEKEFKKIKKDGGQLFTYFQQDKNADVLLLYASEVENNNIKYRNEIIKIEDDYRQTANVKDFYERWNKLPKANGIFDSWVKTYEYQSKSLTKKDLKVLNQEDSSFIFNRFLEILRHNVVSDKPNAFNKIFTLFLCKIVDENRKEDESLHFQWLEGEDTHISFQKRLTDLYNRGMLELLEKKVTDVSDSEFDKRFQQVEERFREEFKEILTEIRLKKNNEFAIKEVYDDHSFNENAKVVKEVVELLQVYQLRYNYRQQFLSDFFELLLTTGLKQESGQFFTPVPIARFIIKSLPLREITEKKLQEGNSVDLLPAIIDYAAGSGHFITESMEEVQKYIETRNNNKYNPTTGKTLKTWKDDQFSWAFDYVYGIEKDYRLVKTAKVSCYLHGDGLAKVIHGDGLGDFSSSKEFKDLLKETDKTYWQDNKQFDIVISNPPYSVSAFKGTMMDEECAKKAFKLYGRLTDQSSEIECLFIERAKQLLKDGGVAGIILPSSILSNSGIYTETREILLKYFEVVAITELGSNTFMATGTNTVILFLRRRNNADADNIKASLEKFFTNMQDITINGIEKPVSKYVNHVWEGINFTDYITLLQRTPNGAINNHEIFKEYNKKINAKNDIDKWNSIIEIEKEKLFYFIITYPKKIVLVKSGEKDEEKKFLGYEFSNRRGSEGIHPIQREKSIDECTKLYDINSFDNPEKAGFYIYKAFTNDFDFEIDESLKNNINRINLVDMLTFDRIDFEKTISLNVKKKVKIESKWNILKLSEILSELQSGNRPKGGVGEYKEGIPSLGGEHIGLDGKIDLTNLKYVPYDFFKQTKQGILKDFDILICKDGALTGKIAFFKKEDFSFDLGMVNEHVFILRTNSNCLQKYLFLILFLKNGQVLLKSNISGQAQGGLNRENLLNIRIPLPPKDIQEKIIFEIGILEEKEKVFKKKIFSFNKNINEIMNNVSPNRIEKLENIAILIKRGKSAKYGTSNIQIIKSGQARGYKEFDFSSRHFVDNNFIIDERLLQKGDILINSTGVGTAGRVTLFNFDSQFVVDSHITILRPDIEKALPEFILYSLANIGFKTIENMAMGQSGQIELSISTIQNIKIPLPSLEEQKQIVSEIEKIEIQINELEKEIKTIPKEKELILKNYLN